MRKWDAMSASRPPQVWAKAGAEWWHSSDSAARSAAALTRPTSSPFFCLLPTTPQNHHRKLFIPKRLIQEAASKSGGLTMPRRATALRRAETRELVDAYLRQSVAPCKTSHP